MSRNGAFSGGCVEVVRGVAEKLLRHFGRQCCWGAPVACPRDASTRPNASALPPMHLGFRWRWRMLTAIYEVGLAGRQLDRSIRHLFLFTGADPNTDWLEGSGIALDAKGFVLTGNGRPLQTSMHGVFAIGDVRSGSVKRVAASVGEGAQVVAALHDFLAASDLEQDVVATH